MKTIQEIFTMLRGKVKFRRGKYNPTSDAVWLSAFARAGRGGAEVLDVGIGTGGVSLCFLNHNPDAKITGIDISAEMLDECAENFSLNNRAGEFIKADALTWKAARTFDVVMTNPPYFKGSARAGGVHHLEDLSDWIRACAKRVKPHGYFYTIVDAARLAEVVSALPASFAAVQILPLFGAKQQAERVLVSARLGVKTGTAVFPGLSMNDARVLRDGLTIRQIFTMVRPG